MPVQSVPYTPGAVYACIEQTCSCEQNWPEYRQAMERALCADQSDTSGHLPVLFLPGLCCQAAGGDPRRATGVAAAWVLLYTAAHILDDVEDGDIADGLGPPINVATGLIFTAIRILAALRRAQVAGSTLLAVIEDFTAVALEMCGSQHADLTLAAPSLEQCWKIVGAKAGAWFSLACRAGAMLADATDELAACYGRYGYHLGLLVQISDDLDGLWSRPGRRSDLAAGKQTLPVAYSLSVAPAGTKEQLIRALELAARDARAEAEARALMGRMGASLYLAVEAQRHLQEAQMALCLAHPTELANDQLLDLLQRVVPTFG